MARKRNPYEEEIDFTALALEFPGFNKHLKKNGQLDFSDPYAVKQLTTSLLKRDFGLSIELPSDRLCPPVPNRLNYILWLQDLLDTTSDSYDDRYHAEREVTGLDIGTGASCIYPLLGCASRPKWRFAATDIDEKNLDYARQNVLANDLKARIRPVPTTPDGPLIPLDELGLESIDFTMCNPPFYASPAELLSSARAKSRPPHSACTGSEVEMVTAGGEVAFVERMIAESRALGDRVQWYSSMVGKLASLGALIERLKQAGASNWAATEFVQGGKTRRWAVAWSWGRMRPSLAVSRGKGSLPKNILPFPSEARVVVSKKVVGEVVAGVEETMGKLDVQWRFKPALAMGVGFASGNVWSRSARRSRAKSHSEADPDKMDEDEDGEPAIGFRIEVKQSQQVETDVDVVVRWLQGTDTVLFESFCGMLKRAVNA